MPLLAARNFCINCKLSYLLTEKFVAYDGNVSPAIHFAHNSPAAQLAIVPNPDIAQFMKAPFSYIGPINGQFSFVMLYHPP